MKQYNFDKKVDRREYYSYKWDYKDDDVISLTIADTDFESSKEVREAVNDIASYGRLGYTRVPNKYFDSYVNWFSSRYNASFKREDCLFSTGIVASLDSVLKRVAKLNEGVMMFTPIYNVFFSCIKNNGLVLKECPFIYDNGKYSIDFKLFDKLIKEVKVFILCNPHNPNGYRFTKKEVDYISNACKENGVYLLSDEIHCDINYNGKIYHSSLVDLDNPLLITFLSPGKTFNLAGIHSSILVIKNKELREKIGAGLYQDDIGEASIFSINTVINAYNFGSDYVYELNAYLLKNKEFLMKFIKNNIKGITVIDNPTTYLMWLDISSFGLSSTNFCTRLLKEFKVATLPGIKYGDDRFSRINIATQFDNLKTALQRLKLFVDQL